MASRGDQNSNRFIEADQQYLSQADRQLLSEVMEKVEELAEMAEAQLRDLSLRYNPDGSLRFPPPPSQNMAPTQPLQEERLDRTEAWVRDLQPLPPPVNVRVEDIPFPTPPLQNMASTPSESRAAPIRTMHTASYRIPRKPIALPPFPPPSPPPFRPAPTPSKDIASYQIPRKPVALSPFPPPTKPLPALPPPRVPTLMPSSASTPRRRQLPSPRRAQTLSGRVPASGPIERSSESLAMTPSSFLPDSATPARSHTIPRRPIGLPPRRRAVTASQLAPPPTISQSNQARNPRDSVLSFATVKRAAHEWGDSLSFNRIPNLALADPRSGEASASKPKEPEAARTSSKRGKSGKYHFPSFF